jgi:UDP-MurNAc hydroxylase
MKIQWYRSATIGIFSDQGTSILCDPWMTDGAFIGSWYHWPPLEGGEFDFLVNKKWDAIYISHFHADHFDRKLLAAIIRHQASIKVLIPSYQNKWLKRAVLNCGVAPQNLLELPNNHVFPIKDINIKILTADYCNPEICGVSVSCQSTPRKQSSNDSLAVFESDGQRILNANDALAVATAQKIWPLIGEVDLLLGHFGGAGPYPQCFADLSNEEKKLGAQRNGWAFVDRLIKTAESLKARFTLPYAGQYVLGGSLSELNIFRSIIPMTQVLDKIQSSGVTQALSLKPFAEFDLTHEVAEEPWSEPSLEIFSSYINKIKQNPFPYQHKVEDWPDDTAQFLSALSEVKNNFEAFLKNGGIGSNSSITIKSPEIQRTLNFAEKSCSISMDNLFQNHTIIEIDHRLLKRIVLRKSGYSGFTPFHFNQAEIGSHMIWRRTGIYPRETQFLNYMHHYLD